LTTYHQQADQHSDNRNHFSSEKCPETKSI
jgi:hypothetical protein